MGNAHEGALVLGLCLPELQLPSRAPLFSRCAVLSIARATACADSLLPAAANAVAELWPARLWVARREPCAAHRLACVEYVNTQSPIPHQIIPNQTIPNQTIPNPPTPNQIPPKQTPPNQTPPNKPPPNPNPNREPPDPHPPPATPHPPPATRHPPIPYHSRIRTPAPRRREWIMHRSRGRC